MEKTQSELTLKLKPQITETDAPNNNRYRDWVFTLNNYQLEDINRIQQIKSVYQVFGKEIAPTTGTPHLQGYIEFENPRRFSGVKNLISDRAHIEIAHSSGPTNQKYCKKDGNWNEWGECSKGQGARSDLDYIAQMIKEDKPLSLIRDTYPSQWIRYSKVIS